MHYAPRVHERAQSLPSRQFTLIGLSCGASRWHESDEGMLATLQPGLPGRHSRRILHPCLVVGIKDKLVSLITWCSRLGALPQLLYTLVEAAVQVVYCCRTLLATVWPHRLAYNQPSGGPAAQRSSPEPMQQVRYGEPNQSVRELLQPSPRHCIPQLKHLPVVDHRHHRRVVLNGNPTKASVARAQVHSRLLPAQRITAI